MKTLFTVFLSLIILAVVIYWLKNGVEKHSILSDETSAQTYSKTEILTRTGIDSVLNLFEQVVYDSLEADYIKFAGYDTYSKSSLMKGRIFYKISNEDAHIPLVGKYTTGTFLPADYVHYKDNKPGSPSFTRYLCMNKAILYNFLDLILALREKGYNDAFIIKDGFRYPSFNKRTGGAPYSHHVYGDAIDLYIGDVDNDGQFSEKTDKKIVYDILDTIIIRNSGGIGRYPGSNVVHFDVRGHFARWDKQ